jgi:hypothetical protein
LTTMPHKPHRVIRYDTPNSEEGSEITIEKRDDSE